MRCREHETTILTLRSLFQGAATEIHDEGHARYDFVVCSSGSVVAGRLAEDPDVSVVLLEAGDDDDVCDVMRAEHWPLNLGGKQDWNFQALPSR